MTQGEIEAWYAAEYEGICAARRAGLLTFLEACEVEDDLELRYQRLLKKHGLGKPTY